MSEIEPLELHLTLTEEGQTAVSLLATHTPLSKGRIKQVMQCGAVWLTRNNGTERIRRAKRLLKSGDQLHLYYNPKVIDQTPPAATLLYDGKEFSVWNKPCGMLSQGSKWGDHTTLYRWAEQQLTPQRPAFIVHRLDRAAQGLMLLAHSKKSAAALSALFQQRRIKKIYRATVHGLFEAKQQPLTIETTIDSKPACSHITLLKPLPEQGRSLLEISIESGRKHQIRRHLSEAGYPIVGDRLYGGSDDREDLMLCSYELSFTSPFDGETKQFRMDDH
ncbi:MAG: RluA family pseudouridine synthase [Gammaproteobacteria bacterium]|nr:RluA family pseudouridine synthase [Gammaproteobacteria bacterium]MBT4607220.1 RluA family pseudouridine synthase [Thiotrichales bacterium]MBT3473281.1 RluA family pseudouridine synthase [Gammaproteobacteria bacterium]MBT3968246.1 RluA family pseudouridine synthase [Gammaproteobacteria bacterium]MBT4080815.1 RluA family pseudouridine synthase [Gammaproteobacteria bacterium]